MHILSPWHIWTNENHVTFYRNKLKLAQITCRIATDEKYAHRPLTPISWCIIPRVSPWSQMDPFIPPCTVNRIWPTPGLCRYNSSAFNLQKNTGCHKKTAASRSKEGIISHSLAVVNSLKILLPVIWTVCPILCFFLEERDWKLEKVQEPLLTQLELEHAEMCGKMWRELCLS